jgi:hypothetical protein
LLSYRGADEPSADEGRRSSTKKFPPAAPARFMKPHPPASGLNVPDLARQLIAKERQAAGPAGAGEASGFRVCEKLRQPLAVFAGVTGYRSLLLRALTLAKAEAPGLDAVQVEADGSLRSTTKPDKPQAPSVASRAELALTGQLLGLLVTFIGEALTLRLVHDVWPEITTERTKKRKNAL